MTTEKLNDETMFADGFELAIIGLDTTGEVFRVIYDKNVMASILQSRDGMTVEEAWEYLEYNVFNTYVGEGTPIYGYGGDYQRVLEFMSQL